jgi:hypothetical protein
MKALFNRAETFLDQMNGSDLIKWKDKVRVIPVTHGYVSPKIKEEIQSIIYEALLSVITLQPTLTKKSGNPLVWVKVQTGCLIVKMAANWGVAV